MSDITQHIRYGKLLKEFHPTLNGELKLSDFSFGSNKKIWWECNVSDDHIWEAKINKRTNGQNCPCCSGKKIVLSNCLATTHPELSKQWHPTKNNKLTPFDVTFGSRKKVWWKCEVKNDHEWDATVVERKDGNNCPFCSGHRVILSNCLATTHPELSKQWHPTKNKTLSPYDIMYGSNKKVWWKCDLEKDHEWESTANKRTSGHNCPCCSGRKLVLSNCLATTHPYLIKEWHPTKNGDFTPYDIMPGSSKKVWWKCSNGHEWKMYPNGRTGKGGANCPSCNESHGERTISKILEKLFIKYESQKKFDGCKNINHLLFDFYLPKYNVCIEYDGEQHFKAIKFFGGNDALIKTQKRDKIKDEYCNKNNIHLLRIPYTKFDDIENIIIKFYKLH